MKISEFAKQRNIARDTITQYIRRNQEMFEGHIKVDGKWLFIDEIAEQILDEKYPLPQPVEIVEDIETIKELSVTRLELAKAEAKIIQLQEQMKEDWQKIAKAESVQLLLESKEDELERERADKTERLKEKDELIAREQERANQECERANQERERADELLKQLEEERKKTWWDKLRGK